tara:strand:+ start:138 stop:1244 length:1107 start_codon:yes stop_codon:yes gene_type:complete
MRNYNIDILSKRIYLIDFLRLIAAFIVVMYHYTYRGLVNAQYIEVDLEFPFLKEIFKYGYLGVDFFFILSGFVILMSVEKKNITSFVKSRFLRLYPVYWVCLSITFLFLLLFGNPTFSANWFDFLTNLTMLNGFLFLPYVDGVYWTLLVEMKFYFLIMFFILIRDKFNFKVNQLIVSYLVITLFSVFIDIFSNKFFVLINYLFSFQYSSLFIAGMTFYLIKKNGLNLKYLIFLNISFGISVFYAIEKVNRLSDSHSHNFSEFTTFLYILSFYTIMFLISVNKLNIINKKWMLKYGMMTYPLYLLHQNIGYILINYLTKYFNKYLVLLFVTSLMFYAAFFISNKIEIHLYRFFSNKINNFKQNENSYIK